MTSNSSAISYDGNGNILTLSRADSASQSMMDELEYMYYTGTDRLKYVIDDVATGSFPNDIDEQPGYNYKYDSIGNLISDEVEQIKKIYWTPSGKVSGIKSTYTVSSSFEIYSSSRLGIADAKVEGISS